MEVMQIMQLLQQTNNPQQMFQSLAQQNPLFGRAMQMGAGKSENQLREIAMNLCREQGMNPQQMSQFFGQFGVR